jgi:hypothetical protein
MVTVIRREIRKRGFFGWGLSPCSTVSTSMIISRRIGHS